MTANYVVVVVISALMLGMSALLYGITMRQREDDRRHFLDLHRADMARLEEMEARLEELESELGFEVEGTETEVITEVSYDPETQVVSFFTPEVEPKTQEMDTVEIAVAIDREWQRRQDEIYRAAMAEIHRPWYVKEKA